MLDPNPTHTKKSEGAYLLPQTNYFLTLLKALDFC